MLQASVLLHSRMDVPVTFPLLVDSGEDLEASLLRLQRTYGAQGFHPPLPPGGWFFPLANYEDFDWRLIGAKPGTRTFRDPAGGTEQREGVWWGNRFYSKRHEQAVSSRSRTMPEAIWFSRASNGSEPPGVAVETSGDQKYVRLVTFKGDGSRKRMFARPPGDRERARPAPPAGPAPRPAAFGAAGGAPATDLAAIPRTGANLEALLDFIRANGKAAAAAAVTDPGTGREMPLEEFARTRWADIKARFEWAALVVAAIERATPLRFTPPDAAPAAA
ncbi:MAG: single-stranded DNA-binding protein [Gemmatimonadota bacterium]